jgi:uncharacterized protein (DUF433 family)
MLAVQKSLRIPKYISNEIDEIAKDEKKDFTKVVTELLIDAIKSYRCPGIIFTEGTTGKRARIAGTGLEVWEIIASYKSVKKNFDRLKKVYHWLSIQQLKIALGYYKFYAEEIDKIIAENEDWTIKKIQEKYPFIPQ